MEFLQNLGPNLPYIGVCLALVCGVVLVAGFVLQVVGGFFDVIFGFFEVFLEVLQGGPIAWCGCLLLIFGCIGCSGFVFIILNASASCAQYSTNFCRWFGF